MSLELLETGREIRETSTYRITGETCMESETVCGTFEDFTEDTSVQDKELEDREKRKRDIHITREICEYGAWIRGELRQKERGSL